MDEIFEMAMLRFVAPAGAPISPIDVGRVLRRLASGSHPGEELKRQVESALGVEHCALASTGRAGLTLILRALRRLVPGRDEIVVPSYTCYSVAASIVKAGFALRIVDVDPQTLDISHDELEQLPLERVLAIVATSLYGLPNDLPRLERFALERGIFLVDDAAQALGACVAGRHCGTFGHVGLLSLDKGKNVSAIDGGLIVTNVVAVADALRVEMRVLPAPTLAEEIGWWLKLVGYTAFLHPRLYWLPNAVPQLELGRTSYTTAYPIGAMGRPAAALATIVLPRLAHLTESRRRRAHRLLSLLHDCADLVPIALVGDARAAYLRLPLLAQDDTTRDRLVKALNDGGIGATGSYPGSIADIPDLEGHIRGVIRRPWHGTLVAGRILTLPTHPFVSERDMQRTATIVRDTLASRSVVARAGAVA